MSKRVSTQRTVFPLDYDRNNCKSDSAFNNWQKAFRLELSLMLNAKACNQRVTEAKELLTLNQ